MTLIQIYFPSADPGSGSASKLIESCALSVCIQIIFVGFNRKIREKKRAAINLLG